MKKSISAISPVFLCLLLCLSFAGCSGKSNIVGQWTTEGRDGVVLTFTGSGDFSVDEDYNFDGTVGSEFPFQSYSLSDGTLTFNGTFAGPVILQKSSSKDCGDGEYYLKGDTLVISGVVYSRVK